MTYEMLEQFRRALLRRKATLFGRRDLLLAEEQELLGEREPDWEDAAASVSAAMPLGELAESDRLELERIRASLDRMERGTYGTCAACDGPIEIERLRAVPETDRCARCADRH